jgi:hypothetical protein
MAVEIDTTLLDYQKLSQAEKLLELQKEYKAAPKCRKAFWEGRMLEASIGLEEHPEGFDCGCLCDTCRSYA